MRNNAEETQRHWKKSTENKYTAAFSLRSLFFIFLFALKDTMINC